MEWTKEIDGSRCLGQISSGWMDSHQNDRTNLNDHTVVTDSSSINETQREQIDANLL